jgi:hypothetical protein
MSENKWTPGPWHQLKTRIDDVNGYQICHLDLHGKSELERDANRMLIAAAPDMAEALRGLLVMLPSKDNEGHDLHRIPQGFCYVRWGDIRQAHAALAKARGEE